MEEEEDVEEEEEGGVVVEVECFCVWVMDSS